MIDANPISHRHAIFYCVFYGSGIIGSLLIYGLYQERIMTLEYKGDMFETSIFLVFCNRVVAVLFSLVLAISNHESLAPQAPIGKYLIVSFSNVYSSTCQYEALKYVSFAVQMLAKSFKMLPVMLWGVVISGKKYKSIDWAIAIVVTWGVTQFLLTGPIEASGGVNNATRGLTLLLGFLAFDGLTSTMQEKLFKDDLLTKYNQMLYVNVCSACVSMSTLLITRTLSTALAFCTAHPGFVGDAFVLSSAAVSGQWFIYSQIKEFGALAFAAIMNVRQLVSILASNQTFGHPVMPGQWFGIVFVFGALFLKSYLGQSTNLEASYETAPLRSSKVEARNALNGVESTHQPDRGPASQANLEHRHKASEGAV